METVSGGGGWGLKQGLLSLDPDTTLLESEGARYDSDPCDYVDNGHIQALGNIAKPGSWVQFLISHQPNPKICRDTVDLSTTMPGPGYINCISFGCMPSSVDDIPQQSSDTSTPIDEKNIQLVVNGSEGLFGALSEAGIFVRTIQNGVETSSKIDVPYSNFWWGMIER